MPSVAEVLAALPAEAEPVDQPVDAQLQRLLERLSRRAVPVNRLRRTFSMGGLPAKIGLAYVVYWLRGLFRNAETRQRLLLETRLRAAASLLRTMGYLRGAFMKLGQTAANFPDIVPDEFVETLGRLHFEAPPMHFALLREHVTNELGAPPEKLFDRFETTAVAAASLGQVHRARLKTGEDVAVKIQYPGIARTIRSDLRNLKMLLFPFRIGRDWENLKSQLEEIRRVLEQETDYRREAGFLKTARRLFAGDDRFCVPRVFDELTTARVLTMEYVDGLSFPGFLQTDPPQGTRDRLGGLIVRSQCRMLYVGRMQYADPHPGNYLVLRDGRLGLIDFGCMREFSDEDWDYLRLCDAAVFSGREQLVEHLLRGTDFSAEELTGTEILELMIEYTRWLWRPLVQSGPFDYGDRAELQRGLEIIRRFTKLAVPRQKPVNVFVQRSALSHWALQYRLRSRVNVKSICDEEIQATGWRQSRS